MFFSDFTIIKGKRYTICHEGFLVCTLVCELKTILTGSYDDCKKQLDKLTAKQ